MYKGPMDKDSREWGGEGRMWGVGVGMVGESSGVEMAAAVIAQQ